MQLSSLMTTYLRNEYGKFRRGVVSTTALPVAQTAVNISNVIRHGSL